MPELTTCPHCGARYKKIPPEMNGRTVRCRKCQQPFAVRIEAARPSRASSGPNTRNGKDGRPRRAAAPAPTVPARRIPTRIAAPTVPSPKVRGGSAKTSPTIRKEDRSGFRPDGAADETTEWTLGQVILGLYDVTQFLGQGGMGRVYKVRHRDWNVDLAVKTPRPDVLAAMGGADDFEREAETWVNLGLHPHTVSCYYVRRVGEIPCVFSEFVSGGSLHDWIVGEGNGPGRLYDGGQGSALERILDLSIQFAWGLKFAHEQGLIHLDVKPANVLITDEGLAKVTDFGLAIARAHASSAGDGSSEIAEAGPTPGTPPYFSPEQAINRPLTLHTDMWSWAVSVLEMFNGGRTWESGTVAAAVLDERLAAGNPESWLPGIPTPMTELLRQCFTEDPALRPQDMGQVAGTLTAMYPHVVGRPYPRQEPRAGRGNADNLNNQAVSLLDLGRTQEAERLLDHALEAQPHHPEATYNRGMVLWRTARLDDDALIRQLLESGRSQRGEWMAAYLLALVHLERDDVRSTLDLLNTLPTGESGRDEVQNILKAASERLGESRRLLATFHGHQGSVNSVALNADGTIILSGSDDHDVGLWDMAEKRRIKTLTGHRGTVKAAAISANGHYAVSGGGDLGSQDFIVRLWNTAAGRELRSLAGHLRTVQAVHITPDGTLAVSGGDDRTVRVWDVYSGECRHTLHGHKGPVSAVRVSPDGKYIFSGSVDQTIKVWAADNGRLLRSFHGHTGRVTGIAFGGKGRYFLSGSADQTLKLWDLVAGQVIRTFAGHRGEVYAVSWRPNAKIAVSGGADQTVRLWDLDTGRCLRTFDGHESWVLAVDLAESGRIAVSGSVDATLKIWKTKGNSDRFRSPMALARVTRSEKVVQAGDNYDNHLAQAEAALAQGRPFEAAAQLAEARSQPGYDRGTAAMSLWGDMYLHLPRGAFKGGWEKETLHGHTLDVGSVCFSPDGRFLVSGAADKTLKVWEVAQGRSVQAIHGHESDVNSVCLTPDGRRVVSGGADRTVRIWKTDTAECLHTLRGHEDRVNAVCVGPSGTYALSGGDDRVIRVWDIATGDLRGRLTGHRSAVNALGMAPDGRWVVSGGGDYTGENSVLKLWDLETGECLRTLEGHERPLNAVCITPDGKWAVSGASDNMVKLWDLSNGQCLATLLGHTGPVKSVAVSSDGRSIISGSYDHTIRLWDIKSGKLLRIFEGHTASVNSVGFSPDCRYAVSASADRTIKIWVLDWALDEPPQLGWDEAVGPWLTAFVALLSRPGVPLAPATPLQAPTWTEDQLQELLYQLKCAGFGWISADVIRRKLAEMAGLKSPGSPVNDKEESVGIDRRAHGARRTHRGWWSMIKGLFGRR